MKALVIDSICPDLQALKGENTSISITGAGTHDFESARAALEYGTYDRYFFLQRYPLAPVDKELLPEWCRGRAEVIDPTTIARLVPLDHVVMMTGRSLLNTLVPIRRLLGTKWPALGFIHSLSGPVTPYLALSMLVAGLNHADALLCSTKSGKLVVERLYELIAENNPALPQEIPIQLPVVPLGIDCRRRPVRSRQEARRKLGFSDEARVLLYFGRFSPVNKCDLAPLMLAFAHEFTDDRDSMTYLVLAGDDTQHGMAPALREYAAAIGCGERIVVRPNCNTDERSDLFGAADIFMSPSDNLQETFGLTIIEAMAAGLPVVASDWNGYKELVTENVTGFLCPVYWPIFGREFDLIGLDASLGFESRTAFLASATAVDCDALMTCARRLIDNPELRRKFGEAGRRRAVEEFDYRVIVRQWEQLADELVAKARSLSGAPKERFDPLAYSPQWVFEHYPTRALKDSDTLRITKFGRAWLDGRTTLETPRPSATAHCDNALKKGAHALQKCGDSISLADLVCRLRENNYSDLMARVVIGRLQKYGVLAVDACACTRSGLKSERASVPT